MSEQYPGKYIVIEGTDGAGTTTQRDLLVRAFHRQGIGAIAVAEPGGTVIGNAQREIIKNGDIYRKARSSFAMFTIARDELADQVLRPALLTGTNVVSDRNNLSSFAYQGFGDDLDLTYIERVSKEVLDELFLPDTGILLDVPVDVSWKRITSRGDTSGDYFEKKGPKYFEKVRQGYLWSADKFGFTIIDGTESIQAIHTKIATMLGVTALILDEE